MASAYFSVLRLELDIQSLQNNFYFIGLQQKYWLDKDLLLSLLKKKNNIIFKARQKLQIIVS